MDEIIEVKDKYYILATSAMADDRTRVLKDGETFGIFDRYGDIVSLGLGEQGIFHEGTRFLSRMKLRLNDTSPHLLSSAVKSENDVLSVDLTNIDFISGGQLSVPRGIIHIGRTKTLWNAACFEEFKVSNFSRDALQLELVIQFGADFCDIFEVRGTTRLKRGELLKPEIQAASVVLSYMGLDKVLRRTTLEANPQPSFISESEMRFQLNLEGNAETTLNLRASFDFDNAPARTSSFSYALAHSSSDYQLMKADVSEIKSSNQRMNDWLRRSEADIFMMCTRTESGLFPYAGVPWFSCPFGRDSLIGAFQLLTVFPSCAKTVLDYLAKRQATELIPEKDAQPGKILHEWRSGEMAALGEVPFGGYYGTVDATPLFVMLAGAYFKRTNDLKFMDQLWPHIEQALHWMKEYGDIDDDGFVEYARVSSDGLVQQGWKDSNDSVSHRNGELAEAPIALCEVQGYCYGAKMAASEICAALGKHDLSVRYLNEAQDLQERFDRFFWSPELGCYALALDGKKQPCLVKSSNAGHCLWTGIAKQEHAWQTAQTLLSPAMFSGWGVRTLAVTERRYNPMSYHNGSIWPHDNSIVAAGLARYGCKNEAVKICSALFDASAQFDLNRLPELFCGFERRSNEGPTLYPLACAPQLWAAASVFYLLHAAMGLDIDARTKTVTFTQPKLPANIDQLTVQTLRIGDSTLSFSVTHAAGDFGVNVIQRDSDIKVVIIK